MAARDLTTWKETQGNHADDTTWKRVHLDPNKPPTDEVRTAKAAKHSK